MIAHADQIFIAKERKRKAQQQAQLTINAVLWQIIKENLPEADEDIMDAVLTVPLEDIKNVPPNFTLNVDMNAETEEMTITAGVKEEKNIILLGDN